MGIGLFRKSAIRRKLKEIQTLTKAAPLQIYRDIKLQYFDLFDDQTGHAATIEAIHSISEVYFSHLKMPVEDRPEIKVLLEPISLAPNVEQPAKSPICWDKKQITVTLRFFKGTDGNYYYDTTNVTFDALLRREIVRAYVESTYGITVDDFSAEVYVSYFGLDSQATIADMMIHGFGRKSQIRLNALSMEEVEYARSVVDRMRGRF